MSPWPMRWGLTAAGRSPGAPENFKKSSAASWSIWNVPVMPGFPDACRIRHRTDRSDSKKPVDTLSSSMSDILLVEDNPKQRADFEEALTRAGHRVEAVASGNQALTRLKKGRYAILVTDL